MKAITIKKTKCLHCRKPPAKGRKLCYTCNSRQFRKNNPVNAAYFNLRTNAKRRDKPFTITFEYFKQWCTETDYIAGKGRTVDSASVDCVVNDLGYVEGNLQRLSVGENARKGVKVLDYDYRSGVGVVRNDIVKTKNFEF